MPENLCPQLPTAPLMSQESCNIEDGQEILPRHCISQGKIY